MKKGPVKQLALKLAALMLACGILGGCAGGAQAPAPAADKNVQELVEITEEAAQEKAAEAEKAAEEAAGELAEAAEEAAGELTEAAEEAAGELKEAAGETELTLVEDEPEAEPEKPEAEPEKTKAEPKKQEAEPPIDEDGVYTSKDDVALYLYTYHKLPSNFITKKKAKKLGWEGGNLESYAPGKCIGGDYFGNYEGLLPEDEEYHECDIDTLGKKKRGAKRIIWSEDWDIYYTGDHYETFTLLYEGE